MKPQDSCQTCRLYSAKLPAVPFSDVVSVWHIWPAKKRSSSQHQQQFGDNRWDATKMHRRPLCRSYCALHVTLHIGRKENELRGLRINSEHHRYGQSSFLFIQMSSEAGREEREKKWKDSGKKGEEIEKGGREGRKEGESEGGKHFLVEGENEEVNFPFAIFLCSSFPQWLLWRSAFHFSLLPARLCPSVCGQLPSSSFLPEGREKSDLKKQYAASAPNL